MPDVGAVVFDIYRTLIDIDTDEESPEAYELLSRWLSYHGVATDPLALRVRYLELCAEEISGKPSLYPDFDIGAVFSRVLRESKEPDLDVGTKSRELSLLFRMFTTRSISVYPGVHNLLKALQGKVRLGIVSNAQRLFTIPELSKLNLIHFFDPIVLSSDAGVRKPNPQIFQTLLDAIAVPPQEIVFIGDNIFDDVYGASRMGMRTIWLNRGGRSSAGITSSIKADYVVDGGAMEALSAILLPMIDHR